MVTKPPRLVHAGPPRVRRLAPAGPLPPSPAATTLTALGWSLFSERGIAPSDDPAGTGPIHHSGHLNAVLALGSDGVLVGSDTGGVWHLAPLAGDANVVMAYPLSNDWDNPNILSLCAGPDGPGHAYAGCLAPTELLPIGYASSPLLYEAPPHAPAAWHPILTGSYGSVYGVGVGNGRRLVVATATGVWWSPIPFRDPRQRYRWQAALWSGGAAGPVGCTSLVIADGRPVVSSGHGGTIWWGDWNAKGALVMTQGLAGLPNTGRSSLAVCAGTPRVLWSVFAAADINALIAAVERSDDGGRSWRPVLGRVPADADGNPASVASAGGGQGGYNNCIAVRPTDPETVLIGWQSGILVSTDGGANYAFWNGYRPHLHPDIHALYFDPRDTRGRTLFVGSDGGLASSTDLGLTFDSSWNSFLPDLQLASVPCHNGYGTMSLHPSAAGRMAAGLQDNGVVWGVCHGTWRTVDGGDGAAAVFLSDGNLVLGSASSEGAQLLAYRDTAYTSVLTPPYFYPDGTLVTRTLPDGTKVSAGLPDPITEAVVQPGHAGPPVMAVGGNGPEPGTVFGLRYGKPDASDAKWARLANLPAGVAIWSFAAPDDATIFVGTSPPHVYRLDLSERGWTPTELPALPTIASGQPDPEAAITRLVVLPDKSILAAYNDSAYSGGCNSGQIVHFDPTSGRWSCLTDSTTPLYLAPVFGLDSDPWGVLYAATDDHIYLADGVGEPWRDASTGLPRRLHLGHLRFVRYPNGGIELVVASWGRSAWRAGWQPPPGASPGRGGGPGLTFNRLIGSLVDGRLYTIGRGGLHPVGPVDPALQRRALASAAALTRAATALDDELALTAHDGAVGLVGPAGVSAEQALEVEAEIAALRSISNLLQRGLSTLTSISLAPEHSAPAQLSSHLTAATAMVTEAVAALSKEQPAKSDASLVAAVQTVSTAFGSHLQQITAIERQIRGR